VEGSIAPDRKPIERAEGAGTDIEARAVWSLRTSRVVSL
jgi:hypothetical protein